jgi:hypothetical protein
MKPWAGWFGFSPLSGHSSAKVRKMKEIKRQRMVHLVIIHPDEGGGECCGSEHAATG